MRPAPFRPTHPRRGLTLIEMLVVVALVVLMMTILVTIFAAATGAITVSRAIQELDQGLRHLDGTLRRDLEGATARMTPPLDPKENLGYFEYSENAFPDVQGEDTDDTLRFTARAPEGQPFTGRIWVPAGTAAVQPIMVTSQFAEIIYFLRNGNLYRRVLLVAPERRGSLGLGPNAGGGYTVAGLGNVSWQGVNDISARPGTIPFGQPGGGQLVPVPNTLGDLTKRENRFPSPRFCDDFNFDGIPDDGHTALTQSGFGIPDYYPTLYPNVFAANPPLLAENAAPTTPARVGLTYDIMPFPYVFPGMYSSPAPAAAIPASGAIHILDPTGNTFNHAPLPEGDSLLVPTAAGQFQTWWGFPTWRETLSANWADPVWRLNDPAHAGVQLPALTRSGTFSLLPPVPGPFSDNAGNATALGYTPPANAWQDDLIMTGVRSFDVKAYEPNAIVYDTTPPYNAAPYNGLRPLGAGYYDLGYLSQRALRFSTFGFTNPTDSTTGDPAQANLFLAGFGHEGRMPPLRFDFRFDPQWPQLQRNVGDNNAGVIRLRRVFDTWSTTYTNAPSVPLNPLLGPPYNPPVYPSYPPPYEAPLRGIQIQIRVVDPKNERVKTLTIRQDFTNKL